MLIETDPVDLSKPLVFYDGKEVYKAVLVSKRYGGYQRAYFIIHMPKQDTSHEVSLKDGMLVEGQRRIYNYFPEHATKLFDPDAPVTSEEAGTF